MIEVSEKLLREFTYKMEQILQHIQKVGSTNEVSNNGWLSQNEALELLKVSKRTLQKYRDEARLPHTKVGKKIYYKREDVEALLNRNYVKSFKDEWRGAKHENH